MSDNVKPDFQLNSITISDKLHFAYRYRNQEHPDRMDAFTAECHTQWHPDLKDTIAKIVKEYFQKLGFKIKNDAWAGIKAKKIKVKNVKEGDPKVSIDMIIVPAWDSANVIDVSGGEIVIDDLEELIDEAQAYLEHRKNTNTELFQGDLFIEKDVKETPEPAMA